jgi:hypothetical protein
VHLLLGLHSIGRLRLFGSVVAEVLDRGHRVTLVFEAAAVGGPKGDLHTTLERLRERSALLDVVEHPPGEADRGVQLRALLDYLRFFDPPLDAAPAYRDRMGRRLNGSVATPRAIARMGPQLRATLTMAVRNLEHRLPVPAGALELVRRVQPDAVAVSPLLLGSARETAVVRAAQALGIPAAACVGSWDNLTHMGRMHVEPELVTVWNARQRDEARDLHGVDPATVRVVGTPHLDAIADRPASCTQREHRRTIGLPEERAHLLYAGSAPFIAPDELSFVHEWISTVRSSGVAGLADVPIHVRPHPFAKRPLPRKRLERLLKLPDVAVHPLEPALHVTGDEAQSYVDAIRHAAAVVGINTSAMAEAALFGKGVYTILSPRNRSTQREAPHFHHLTDAGGGLVVARDSWTEHAADLAAALSGEDAGEASGRAARFAEAFLRPQGLHRASTPLMVDALEELAAMAPGGGAAVDRELDALDELLRRERG